jgi:phenylacetate-CoA ligase
MLEPVLDRLSTFSWKRKMDLHAALVKNLLYPLNEFREGTNVASRLRDLEASQYADGAKIQDLQFRKLKALLDHAFRNCPLYSERFRAAGISPADIKDFSDLRKLPVLTKDDLKTRLQNLVAASFKPEELHRRATGGSTGEHTPFYRDNHSLQPKHAVEFRFNRWAGWDIGQRLASVSVAIQDLAQDITLKGSLRNWLIDRDKMFFAGNLDEQALASHARNLRAFAPVLIKAFPNPLFILAKYLKDTSADPVRPRGIITFGEPLLVSQRDLFNEVFKCPVFNCYASRECGHHACECENHEGLHIAAESLILEFEKDDKPVAPGEPGHILITDLENYGMPFIRYEIQDMGVPMTGSCSCGRSLPLMAMEAGRVSDFLISPADGSLVPGASMCHYLIAEGPEVGQVQIIQDARDHLTIRVARKGTYAQRDFHHFEQVLEKIFKGRMRSSFVQVDSIAREKSGKYRFCINKVAASASPGTVDTIEPALDPP